MLLSEVAVNLSASNNSFDLNNVKFFQVLPKSPWPPPAEFSSKKYPKKYDIKVKPIKNVASKEKKSTK